MMLSLFSEKARTTRVLPRWARWIVLFIVPTLLLGLVLASSDLLGLGVAPGRRLAHQHDFIHAIHHHDDPYWRTIKKRFLVGIYLGASLGAACVAWNVIKREDP